MRTTVFILSLLCGCSSRDPRIYGEWVGADQCLYLRITRDSLSYARSSLAQQSETKSLLRYSDGFLQEPSPLKAYEVRSGIIYLRDSLDTPRRFGRIGWKADSLTIQFQEGFHPIVFRKLLCDSTIVLQRVQLSSFGCYGNCPIYDVQLDSSGTLYYHGIQFTKNIGDFVAFSNRRSFLFCQEVVRKAFIREDKHHFQMLARHIADLDSYGLAVFYNRQQSSYYFNAMVIPPELLQLYFELDGLAKTSEFREAGHSIDYLSRKIQR